MKSIQPIPHEAALLIGKNDILVVADLHIGIEQELFEHGVRVPSQTETMIQRLIRLIEKYNPCNIILLGDVKHNIPSSTYEERTDVKHFLEKLKNYGTLHIVPGNHDGNIKHFVPSKVQIHPSDGFILDNIGFIHGHRWPDPNVMAAEFIIVGHTHPTIMLTDRLGYKTYESCWLRGKSKNIQEIKKYENCKKTNIIVLPAFNPICGGIAVNKEPFIGPFAKIFDYAHANVYLLDGSLLGKLKDIK
jgi:uncharacterized protein